MAEFREVIKSKKTTLCKLTSATDIFLDRCCEEHIITEYEKSELDTKTEGYKRNRAFYDMVLRKDCDSFLKLLKIMEEQDTRQSTDVLNILGNWSNSSHGIPDSTKQHQKCQIKRKNKETESQNIFFEVGEPVTSFVGRQKDLERLHEYVMRNSEKEVSSVTVISQLTSVSGLGGIGKTTLARKYARSYANYFDQNVIWINAETSSSMEESFTRLADKIGVHAKNEKNQIILDNIYSSLETRNYLLIFDNVETFDGMNGVQRYLPKNPGLSANRPYILMTSRNWRILQTCKVLELSVLSEEEATSFIKQQLKFENEDDVHVEMIQKLVRKLECLPLALQQAVAFIRNLQQELELSGETSVDPIEEYLRLLEEDSTSIDLLDYKFASETGDDYEFTVLSTWTVTISKIKNLESGELALEFMRLIAYFESDDIQCSDFFMTFEKEKIESATNVLKKYSMIEKSRGVISVHRLVQHVTRIQNKHRECELLRFCMKKIVLEQLQTGGNIRKHIASIWRYSLQHPELISEFSRVGLDLSDGWSHEEIYDTYLTYKNTSKDTQWHGLELLTHHMSKYKWKKPWEYRSKIVKELEAYVPIVVTGWKNTLLTGTTVPEMDIYRMECLAINIQDTEEYKKDLYKSAFQIHQIVFEYYKLEKYPIEFEYRLGLFHDLASSNRDDYTAALNEVLSLTFNSDIQKARHRTTLKIAIKHLVKELERAVFSPSPTLRPLLVEQVNLLVKRVTILKDDTRNYNLEEYVETLIILIHRLVLLDGEYQYLLKYSKDLSKTCRLLYKSIKTSHSISEISTNERLDSLFEFLVAAFSDKFDDQNRSESTKMAEICISVWSSTFYSSRKENKSKKLIEFLLNARMGVEVIRLIRTLGFSLLSIEKEYSFQIQKINSITFQLIEVGRRYEGETENRNLFMEESLRMCEWISKLNGNDCSPDIGMLLSFIANQINFISASLELHQFKDVLKYSDQLYSFLCAINTISGGKPKNYNFEYSNNYMGYYSKDYFIKLKKLASALFLKANQVDIQILTSTNDLRDAAIIIYKSTWEYFINQRSCSFNYESIIKCFVQFTRVDEISYLSKEMWNCWNNDFKVEMFPFNLAYNLIKFGRNSEIEKETFEEAHKIYKHYLIVKKHDGLISPFRIFTLTKETINEVFSVTMELKVDGALECLRVLSSGKDEHQFMPTDSQLQQVSDTFLQQARNEGDIPKRIKLIRNIQNTFYFIYKDYYLVNIQKSVSLTPFDTKPLVKCFVELEDLEGMRNFSRDLQHAHSPAAKENELLHWIVLRDFASNLRDQVSGMQNFGFREEFLSEADSISKLLEDNI